MFNTSEKLRLANLNIDELEKRLDAKEREIARLIRDHESDMEDQEEKYEKRIRQIDKSYAELSERANGHEEESTTLREEKLKAEQLARDARAELRKVQDELLETQTKVKVEKELMEHNLKILMESSNIELQKKELVINEEASQKVALAKEEAAKAIADVKESFNDKLAAALVERSEANAKTLNAILDRLTTVNVNTMVGGGQPTDTQNDK